MTGQPRDRIVTGNISLSLDGRVTGPAGDHDMGWIVPHALTDESRAQLLKITSSTTNRQSTKPVFLSRSIARPVSKTLSQP